MAVLSSRLLCPALAAAIATLTACGGDSSAPGTPTGSATGTLTDSAIAGVQYSTSSGVSGVTDASGHFQYNPGDTVTFKIGGLTLGTVAASGSAATITPIEIVESSDLSAADKQKVVANLLVLLQSLDSDGDPANGISIPAAVGTALTSTVAAAIDLSADTTTFAASSELSGLAATAGGTVVDPEAALAHFKAQFMKDVAGVYALEQEGGVIAFRINADGSYLMAEVATAGDGGQPGIERGHIDWNPLTGEITASTIDLDTNGEWGLSHPFAGEHVYFALNDGNLVVRASDADPATADEVFQIDRLGSGSGLAGAWVLDHGAGSATSLAVQQFLFLGSGHYLMIDPVGDEEASNCGDAGVEYGSYSVSGSTVTVANILADSNGCAGLHVNDPGADDHDHYTTLTVISNDGGTLTVKPDDADDNVSLLRPVTAILL